MLMLYVLIILISGLLFQEILRRKPSLTWFFFFLVPLGLWPFWTKNPELSWFFWSKLYITFACVCFYTWMRENVIEVKKWHCFVFYFLFFLNMIDPTWKLSYAGNLSSFLNAITGLLLIFLLPPMKSVSIDHHRHRDFLWDLPYAWIFQYTLWNWLFVQIIYPDKIAIQTGMILAPLLVGLFNRKIWFQARGYTLSFYLLMGATFLDLPQWAIVSNPIDDRITLILSMACCIWVSLSFLYLCASKIKIWRG